METCIKGKTTCEEKQYDTCDLTPTVNQYQITLQESYHKSWNNNERMNQTKNPFLQYYKTQILHTKIHYRLLLES